MRKAVSLFIISLIFFGCSKKSSEPPVITTITITNNMGEVLENVVVGRMNLDEGQAKLIQNLGPLNPGATSEKITIEGDAPAEIYLYFDFFNKTFMITDGYGINKGKENNFGITSNVKVSEVEKNSTVYPN